MKHARVQIKGTDLVGTVAHRSTSFQYYETKEKLNTAIYPIYFSDTGEMRFFDGDFLEWLDD
ncbi:hypothetical protein CQ020_03840 [Arthrobacter sp. MYb23]|nr:hypothetical protein CQ038_03695 [Arthrobacter sp. MYb51]PRB98603.1 hypothetical protein CQ020_03840 [Arthrobacter sp. MYb23]